MGNENTGLKEAYKTMDVVIQEVVLAEQAALENICIKLGQENTKANSPAIAQIIDILRDWGKVPAVEIKEKTLAL